MSSQLCTTIYEPVLRPGTGGIFPVPDRNWRASAVSIDRVSRGKPWRYSFLPRRSSTFITGLFDDFTSAVPDVALYQVAIDFDRSGFRVLYNGARSQRIPYPNSTQRLAITHHGSGRYSVTRGDEEVWRSP